MLINQISEADLKDGRFSLKGSGDQMYDSDVVFFLTVKDDEKQGTTKRTIYCSKDRVNGKKWKYEIPNVHVVDYSEFKTERSISIPTL